MLTRKSKYLVLAAFLLHLCLQAVSVGAAEPDLILPFSSGTSLLCTQGTANGGGTSSHVGSLGDSLDFGITSTHSQIMAAASGKAYIHAGNGLNGCSRFCSGGTNAGSSCNNNTDCPSGQCLSGSFGNHVTIDHGLVGDGTTDHYFSVYAHLHAFSANVIAGQGVSIQAGDEIGTSNQTGYTCGEHIHFALHRGDPKSNAINSRSIHIPNITVKDLSDDTVKTLSGDDLVCGLGTVGRKYESVPYLINAQDDQYYAQSGYPILADVLTNDTIQIQSGQTLFTNFTQGLNGSVDLSQIGIVYTPNSGYAGSDAFTYTITDSSGNTSTANVSVAVKIATFAINDVIEVTSDVNLRNAPFGTVLVTLTQGEQGVIIGMPEWSSPYWWWQVDFGNNNRGYVIEPNIQKINVVPPPSGSCSLGQPLGTVTVPSITRTVSYDGVGFDSTRTADPAWVNVAGTDYMYYAGVPFGNTQDLGLAISTDGGQSWNKATDVPLIPRTTAPYWATQRIVPMRVMHENGEFRLWYWGNNSNLFTDAGNIHGFGYASSTDGMNWTTVDTPIRVESGPREGARLLEVVKVGTRYRAYYDDHNNGLPTATYVADSADGITFVGPDQRVPFGDNYILLAATTKPGETCTLGIWKDRNATAYVATTSANGVDQQVVSTINLPTDFTPRDIAINGQDVTFYGSLYEGNVNWSFGNFSLAVGRGQFFQ